MLQLRNLLLLIGYYLVQFQHQVLVMRQLGLDFDQSIFVHVGHSGSDQQTLPNRLPGVAESRIAYP